MMPCLYFFKSTLLIRIGLFSIVTLTANLAAIAQDGITVQIETVDSVKIRYTRFQESEDNENIFGISNRYYSKSYITKFDPNLNIIWSKAFNEEMESVVSIDEFIETKDSKLVLGISQDHKKYIVILDTSGLVLQTMLVEVNGTNNFALQIAQGDETELAKVGIQYRLDSTETIGVYSLGLNHDLEALNIFSKTSKARLKLSLETNASEYAISTANNLYIFDQNHALKFQQSIKELPDSGVFGSVWNLLDFNSDYVLIDIIQMDIDWWNTLSLIDRETRVGNSFDGHGVTGGFYAKLLTNNEIDVISQSNDPYSPWYSSYSYTFNADDFRVIRGFEISPTECEYRGYNCSLEAGHAYVKKGDFRYYSFSGGIEERFERIARIRNPTDFCFENVEIEALPDTTWKYGFDTVSTPSIAPGTMNVTLSNVGDFMIDVELNKIEVCTVAGLAALQIKLRIEDNHVILPLRLSASGKYQVMNMNGQILYSNTYNSRSINISFTNQYPAGVYIIRVISSENQSAAIKLVTGAF